MENKEPIPQGISDEEIMKKVKGYVQNANSPSFRETIWQLRDLSQGEDPDGIREQYYKGWSNEDFMRAINQLKKELSNQGLEYLVEEINL